MTRLSTLMIRTATALLLGSTILLGGCHKGAAKDQAKIAHWKGQFDTTIESYKEGQFIIDGAVLSAVDAGSHFAYLRDIGKLPKTVLLVPGDDSGIRKVHLQYLARMSIDYGFAAYYDDGGQLTQISAVNTKARKLEDHHERTQPANDDAGAAASGGYPPAQH